MSRRIVPILLTAALLAAAGSFARAAHAGPGAPGQGSHDDLLCLDCHQGAVTDRERPHVPEESCLRCHPAETLGEGELGFDHAEHGGVETVEMGCAGCHEHGQGADALGAGWDTCALCHAAEMDGRDGEGCRSCHRTLPARVLASQGVQIQHGVTDGADDACLRCHYALSAPPTAATPTESPADCGPCHLAVPPAPEGGEAALHAAHVQAACSACHAGDAHRIREVSSAVRLSCGGCHDASHRVSLKGGPGGTAYAAVCAGCHPEVHQAQQRLFLGNTGADVGSAAAPKFLAGLTCAACHAAPARGAASAFAGSPAGRQAADPSSCGVCHEPRYVRVAEWWAVGGRERAAQVRAYAQAARVALMDAGRPEALAEVERGLGWIALVEEGGAQHNPTLAHRLLREGLARAVEGYRASGAIVPLPPVLGAEPRPGGCSYCHYDIPFQELDLFIGAPHAFHRAADN